jgi:hypothetical protein
VFGFHVFDRNRHVVSLSRLSVRPEALPPRDPLTQCTGVERGESEGRSRDRTA